MDRTGLVTAMHQANVFMTEREAIDSVISRIAPQGEIGHDVPRQREPMPTGSRSRAL